jgi:hypothetical protein
MGKLRIPAADIGEPTYDADVEQAIVALKQIPNPLMRYWLAQLIDLIAQTCVDPDTGEISPTIQLLARSERHT